MSRTPYRDFTDEQKAAARARNRKWNAAHPEAVRAMRKRYYARHAEREKERARRYYEEHRDEALAQKRDYYERTAPIRRAAKRDYHARNRTRENAANRAYYAENRGYILAHHRRRRRGPEGERIRQQCRVSDGRYRERERSLVAAEEERIAQEMERMEADALATFTPDAEILTGKAPIRKREDKRMVGVNPVATVAIRLATRKRLGVEPLPAESDPVRIGPEPAQGIHTYHSQAVARRRASVERRGARTVAVRLRDRALIEGDRTGRETGPPRDTERPTRFSHAKAVIRARQAREREEYLEASGD